MKVDLKDYFTQIEAAEYIGVTLNTIRIMQKQHGLQPLVWFNQSWYLKGDVALENWRRAVLARKEKAHYLNGGKPEHEKVAEDSAMQTAQDVIGAAKAA